MTDFSSEISLRSLANTDALSLFTLIDHNRADLTKFWWERTTRSVADSEAFIDAALRLESDNGAPTRGITLHGDLIGLSALHTIDWDSRSSLLGYWIDGAQSGHGYVTEAIRQLLTYEAFGRLALNEVRIGTRVDNLACRRIADKFGFSLVDIIDGPLWETDSERLETARYVLRKEDFVSEK